MTDHTSAVLGHFRLNSPSFEDHDARNDEDANYMLGNDSVVSSKQNNQVSGTKKGWADLRRVHVRNREPVLRITIERRGRER
jgi:hypothetical protein